MFFSATTGELLVIRRCVLEDMGNQCGTFVFEGETMHGCILTCDYDGCNSSSALSPVSLLAWLTGVLSLHVFNRMFTYTTPLHLTT